MIHSILICGGTKEERIEKIEEIIKKKITKESGDVKLVTVSDKKKQISIDQIREIETFLIKKPGKNIQNTVIVLAADLMTEQAQNALLKTLEEPPANSEIILETQNEFSLLPTVRSRCFKIKLFQKNRVIAEDPQHKTFALEFIMLLKADAAKKLEFLEEKKQSFTREISSQFLASAISVLSDLLMLEMGEKNNVINKGLLPELKKIKIPIEILVAGIENFEKIRNDVEKTNVNAKHALIVAILGL